MNTANVFALDNLDAKNQQHTGSLKGKCRLGSQFIGTTMPSSERGYEIRGQLCHDGLPPPASGLSDHSPPCRCALWISQCP